jgi:T-complex protein 1 subunit beta
MVTEHTHTHTLSHSLSIALSVGAPDLDTGSVADMRERGIVESFKLKRQMLSAAAEAAEMILRVDDIIRAAPR